MGDIGMVLLGHSPVGLFDLFNTSAPTDAQNDVIVLRHGAEFP